MNLADIFVPISLFGCFFGIMYLFFMTRHRERMSMIEKGIDLSQFLLSQKGAKPKSYWSLKFIALKLGLAAIGVGLGILVANYSIWYLKMDQPAAYSSMITLFVGLALLIFYFLVTKEEKKAVK